MTESKIARKKLFADEPRIWNLKKLAAGAPSNMTLKRRSSLFRYMWYDVHIENLFNIRESSRNLAAITWKKIFLQNLVDTIIKIKINKIIFIVYKHGSGQLWF